MRLYKDEVVGLLLLGCGVLFSVGIPEALGALARGRAHSDATEYVQNLHPEWSAPVVLCSNAVGDYIPCVVSTGTHRTERLRCRVSYLLNYERGCEPSRQ